MIEIRNLTGEIMATVDGDRLDHQDFSGATLREANFQRADLREVVFRYCNLESAHFDQAQLVGADMRNANLRYACLNGANLSEADLTDAQLNPSELLGANLCGANLTRVDLHGAVMRGARYDKKTIWPEGTDPRSYGAEPVEHDAAEEIVRQAQILLRQRDLEGAIEMLATALWDHPRSRELHQVLGCAYAMKREPDLAYRHFRTAQQIEPHAASVHYDLAVLFHGVGLPSMAVEELERTLHLDARHEKARRLLERLSAQVAEHAPVGEPVTV